ncbi:MAG: hypothetical protein CVU47_12460 [Chloroflexi bacterium HGW-Chloroflexi-9]|nr:MAG: hypothetical protein CVU47_12460 [Chloroflexi bacterium HGW-Chloroflexi-9]
MTNEADAAEVQILPTLGEGVTGVTQLAPGDVVLLRTPHRLSLSQAEEIERHFRERLSAPGVTFVVIDGSLDVSILRPASAVPTEGL